MSEPSGDWQFWWNWWVQAAVAAGTVLAVAVALFGPWLRYVLQPPKLKIALKNSAGERTAIGIRAPDGATRPAFARYYHIRVWNERRFSQATDVALYLLSIEEPDATGKTLTLKWAGEIPLSWQHGAVRGQTPRKIGYEQIADLCHTVQSSTPELGKWVELAVQFAPNELEHRRQSKFNLVATVQARSQEVDSNRLRIEIAWDGGWDDDTQKMAAHLVVRELKAA